MLKVVRYLLGIHKEVILIMDKWYNFFRRGSNEPMAPPLPSWSIASPLVLSEFTSLN